MLVSFHNSYFTARRKVKILIYKVYLFHFFIQIQETASVNQTMSFSNHSKEEVAMQYIQPMKTLPQSPRSNAIGRVAKHFIFNQNMTGSLMRS